MSRIFLPASQKVMSATVHCLESGRIDCDWGPD